MALPGPARVDFFLSYTQADRPWAEWIAWVLEEAGFAIKIQAWDFRPGSNFPLEMQKASAGAERTVPVLSPDYVQSGFAMAEWAAAFAQDPRGENGKVLPIRVRRSELDGLLRSIVYIDLVDLDEVTARERLLAGLARGRAKPASKPVFPGGSRPRFPGEPIAPPDPAEAAARLAKLPLDDVPKPAPLPPGSRMPLSANPLFVGRKEDLRALARSLKVGETAAIGQIAAATGLGGIGKTQLACEFAHRYGRFFEGGVFWMSFADEAAVPAEVAACGRSLGLHPGYDGLPLDQQVRLVNEAWQSPLPRLLVFDNCEDPRLLDQRRPRSGGARLLVTSRRSRWDPALGVKVLALDTLERSASLQLLRRFRPDLPIDEPALDGIAEELGDLPLALHLAGSFLARYQEAPFGQPKAYLEQLRRGNLLSHPSLQGRGAEISPTGHEAHVARTFALSYERLDPGDMADDLAQKLLARAAYFACGEPIPHQLLLMTLQLASADLESALAAEDALDRLLSLGLLEDRGGPIVLHRLVAAFARGRAENREAESAVKETLIKEASRLNDAGLLGPLLAWQPHLRAAAEMGGEQDDPNTAALCAELARHLLMVGDSAEARIFGERSLSIRRRVPGEPSLEVASSLYLMGLILGRQAEFENAWSSLERSLSIRKDLLRDEHPDVAEVLDGMGNVLYLQGRRDKARTYLEQALSIKEKILGPDHPKTVKTLNSLGVTLCDLGDLSGARECIERALRIVETNRGPDHLETVGSLHNLATVLRKQGDLAGARAYLERSLADMERILGPGHPGLAAVLINLGEILVSQGVTRRAQQYLERALALQTRYLGTEHPELVNTLSILGILYFRQRNRARAKRFWERSLEIAEAGLGADHPTTRQMRRNLQLLKHGSVSGPWH